MKNAFCLLFSSGISSDDDDEKRDADAILNNSIFISICNVLLMLQDEPIKNDGISTMCVNWTSVNDNDKR